MLLSLFELQYSYIVLLTVLYFNGSLQVKKYNEHVYNFKLSLFNDEFVTSTNFNDYYATV